MKATVLGCGLVGSLIVRDLAQRQNFEVLAVDSDPNAAERLGSGVSDRARFRTADLSESSAIREVIKDSDVVVGAVPGRFGLRMLQTVIESGKPISDISFAPEDALELDQLARERGVTAVIDAGVSPGLSNLAVGKADSMLDSIDDATIFVGGLPLRRTWPWEYRSVFSPTDVIEEYIRPARMIVGGEIVTKPALSEPELLDFDQLGTLEAFNTDGLRSLLFTTRAANMKEKTLRYPGHIDRMRALREAGFFSDEKIEIDGARVAPRKLTESLLFEQWRRPHHETEATLLRVRVEGMTASTRRRVDFELYDETDHSTGDTSMARTTGFPCAIIAGMLARGEIGSTGVLALEHLGRDGTTYDSIVGELGRRDVELKMTTREMEDTGR